MDQVLEVDLVLEAEVEAVLEVAAMTMAHKSMLDKEK